MQRHCVGQRLGADIQGEVLRGLVGALGLLGFGFRLRGSRIRGFGAFGVWVWVKGVWDGVGLGALGLLGIGFLFMEKGV